jgi:tRNA 2-thiouridine synthesizing protein A
MPVLLTSRGIKKIEPGQLMLVEATDGGSQSDIPSWAKDTGNELVETSSGDGVFRYLIRKK